MMTKTTFQRLQARSMQLAALVFQKSTAPTRIKIEREKVFTSLKRRGNLQHHPVGVSASDHPGSFVDGPPTWA